MAQVSRQICTNCGRSIYNVIIDGVRVPLVLYFVAGQPGDTGPILDVNAPGVKVPSFVRELMQTPINRIELCMECTAQIFGLPLVTADEDPMTNAGSMPDVPTEPGLLDEVSRLGLMHERTIEAVKVARGVATPPGPNEVLPRHKKWNKEKKVIEARLRAEAAEAAAEQAKRAAEAAGSVVPRKTRRKKT